MSGGVRRVLGRIRAHHIILGLLVYAVLLALSAWVHQIRWEDSKPRTSRQTLTISDTTKLGPIPDSSYTMAFLEWVPESPREDAMPVILLHGSPGNASSMAKLGPLLAQHGYRAYALDLPGFGGSSGPAPNYSVLAHAYSVLSFLDHMSIERAHIVGFSMGGGVALHITDLEPERVATLTMLSSIGAQEAEGSGDYYFEHGKYAAGMVITLGMRELVPDFGLFGPRRFWYSFLRNFWDTDQRTLTPIMESLKTPTLILHGRHDFLVPAWGAELHHELIGPSSLVMFDASHFLAFLVTDKQNQPQMVVDHLLPFLDRHNPPGVMPLRYTADFSPTDSHGITLDALGPLGIEHTTAWWIVVLAIILGTFISEDATVIAVGVLIARGEIDVFVGFMGCFSGIVIGDGGLWAIGRFAGRRVLQWPVIGKWIPERSLARWGRWFDKHAIKAVLVARAMPGLRLPTYLAAGLLSRHTALFIFWAAVAAIIWTPLLLILAGTLGSSILLFLEGTISGPFALIAAVVLLLFLLRMFELTLTWTGRHKLRRSFARLGQPEFWPSVFLYLPVIPKLLLLSLRHKPMTFSCANPGISNGGGIVGESKVEILKALGTSSQWVLPAQHIPSMHDPLQRAAVVEGIIESDESYSYPVILKPNSSQRGFGMKLVRSKEDVDRYFANMTQDAMLQKFHPGPHELGVLWARDRTDTGLAQRGTLISITRKVFPVVTGDGSSTLERLIWRHKRFRMQAETFLERWQDKRDAIIPEGEQFRLAQAGCHSQGTMFVDASEFNTEALLARFDEIASAFHGLPDADGKPTAFDFGRFDIRYDDEEALKQGRGFAIVELNGTLSESAHCYDPEQSMRWMYRIMFRHWETLYEIGRCRRQMGGRPVSFRQLVKHIQEHYTTRQGDPVSD
jgi:pimeloyl-ACP methyl ester carboxylesterase/membrane protein DedA with SNARE-associated domain